MTAARFDSLDEEAKRIAYTQWKEMGCPTLPKEEQDRMYFDALDNLRIQRLRTGHDEEKPLEAESASTPTSSDTPGQRSPEYSPTDYSDCDWEYKSHYRTCGPNSSRILSSGQVGGADGQWVIDCECTKCGSRWTELN